MDEYMNYRGGSEEDHVWALIRLAMESVASILRDPHAGLSLPGRGGQAESALHVWNNWKWRMVPGQISDQLAGRIHRMTRIYGRV